MLRKPYWGAILAGLGAGTVTGLFGGGGGMVLVPLLGWLCRPEEEELFPLSISVMLPVCLVSLGLSALDAPIPFRQSLPYLLGSALGGFCAGKWGRGIPALWLHRALGILILWGGFRYLC